MLRVSSSLYRPRLSLVKKRLQGAQWEYGKGGEPLSFPTQENDCESDPITPLLFNSPWCPSSLSIESSLLQLTKPNPACIPNLMSCPVSCRASSETSPNFSICHNSSVSSSLASFLEIFAYNLHLLVFSLFVCCFLSHLPIPQYNAGSRLPLKAHHLVGLGTL